MFMKTRLYTIGLLCSLLFISSCSDRWEQEETVSSGTAELCISRSSFQVAGKPSPLSGEDEITSLRAYRFEEGVLQKVYEPLSVGGDDYRLPLDRLSGTLYVIANEEPACEEGTTKETDWLQTVLTADRHRISNYFTGKADLSGKMEKAVSIPLALTRGVARFDFRIEVPEGTVSVKRFAVKQVARQAYLFPGDAVRSPEGTAKEDCIISTPDAPLTRDSLGILYVYEQANPDLSVSLEAEINGKVYAFEQPLPSDIRRNTVYAIVLRKDVLQVDAQLTVEAWGEGDSTAAYPDLTAPPQVDAAASELPAGAEVTAGKDGVNLPYGPVEMVLAVACDDELELLPVDASASLEVEPLAGQGLFEGRQRFRIRKPLFPPEQPPVETALRFRRKGMQYVYPEDVITLRLAGNPSQLSGKLQYAVGTYAFDFERYIDNELGVFTLPAEKELTVEYEAGEDAWIKLDPVSVRSGEGAYRVLAGWRPNDVTANGRRQSATLVISNRADGSQREEYTVSRRNYGLPVTWMHGIWWCKYNARGDSRSFEDQVLSSDDPARRAGQTVFEYLGACPPEAFFDLWKWAYQGDSGTGLQVIDKNGTAALDGYNHQVSVHINRLPADALAPEGYELPSMEDFNRIFDATDYVWVMWNGTHTLRTPWEGHSQVKRLQKRRNDVTVGNVALPSLILIEMWSPDFPEHEPVTWYGVASQWNDSEGVFHNGHYNNILFGVHSPEGSGWFIPGKNDALYLHKNGGAAKDTRVLRFRKSEVEYVY